MKTVGYFPNTKVEVNDIIEKAKKIKVSNDVKNKIINVLKNGKIVASYRGFACCRVCGTILGTQDLEYNSFVFPSKWEHYVIDHNILPVFNFNEISTEFIDNIKKNIGN